MVHNPKLQHDVNFDPDLHFGINLERERVHRYIQHTNLTSKAEDCNSGGDAEFLKHRRYRKSKTACDNGDFQFEGETPFERESSSRTFKGQTIMPGLCRLDSRSDIPLVVSRRWVKEAGREAEISTNFKRPSSYSLSGHVMEFTGIVRNLVFNSKGSSTRYRKDFFVCDQLDSFVDFIIGAKFILEEWQVLIGDMKRRIAGWFSHKKDAQRAREKEPHRKQQEANKSYVSQ